MGYFWASRWRCQGKVVRTNYRASRMEKRRKGRTKVVNEGFEIEGRGEKWTWCRWWKGRMGAGVWVAGIIFFYCFLLLASTDLLAIDQRSLAQGYAPRLFLAPPNLPPA